MGIDEARKNAAARAVDDLGALGSPSWWEFAGLADPVDHLAHDRHCPVVDGVGAGPVDDLAEKDERVRRGGHLNPL